MCGNWILGPLLLALILALIPPATLLYGLPTWITLDQPGPDRLRIRLINWIFGWTGIGWIYAFMLAWIDGKRRV